MDKDWFALLRTLERQRFVNRVLGGVEKSLPFPNPSENAEFILGHVDGLRTRDPKLPYYKFPLPTSNKTIFDLDEEFDLSKVLYRVVTYRRERVLSHPRYRDGHKVYYRLLEE